jgi:hypothetical protein
VRQPLFLGLFPQIEGARAEETGPGRVTHFLAHAEVREALIPLTCCTASGFKVQMPHSLRVASQHADYGPMRLESHGYRITAQTCLKRSCEDAFLGDKDKGRGLRGGYPQVPSPVGSYPRISERQRMLELAGRGELLSDACALLGARHRAFPQVRRGFGRVPNRFFHVGPCSSRGVSSVDNCSLAVSKSSTHHHLLQGVTPVDISWHDQPRLVGSCW